MSKENIILIGGGGHCKSCIDVIEQGGRFNICGILDLKEKVGQKVLNYPIIASDDDLPSLIKEYKKYLVTIGFVKTPDKRVKLYNQLKALNASLPVIVSPFSMVSKYSKIEEGTIIMHNVIINAGAIVGANCIINTNALVEHDAVIGNNCHISTGAIINGGVIIGDSCLIGSNATVLQYIHCGNNNIVGAATTLTKDLENDMLAIGSKTNVTKIER